jgi:hypothetical protein
MMAKTVTVQMGALRGELDGWISRRQGLGVCLKGLVPLGSPLPLCYPLVQWNGGLARPGPNHANVESQSTIPGA